MDSKYFINRLTNSISQEQSVSQYRFLDWHKHIRNKFALLKQSQGLIEQVLFHTSTNKEVQYHRRTTISNTNSTDPLANVARK